MDIIQHTAWGYAVGSAFNAPWYVRALSAVSGAAPDLIGFAEQVVKNDYNLWNWYAIAHQLHWWNFWNPPYMLHLLGDILTHSPGNEWWAEGLPIEIIGWVGVLAVIVYFEIRNRRKLVQ